MSKCMNQNCNNNPLESMKSIVISIDGDLVCCPACKDEYEKQKAHFFNHVIHNDKAFERWFNK